MLLACDPEVPSSSLQWGTDYFELGVSCFGSAYPSKRRYNISISAGGRFPSILIEGDYSLIIRAFLVRWPERLTCSYSFGPQVAVWLPLMKSSDPQHLTTLWASTACYGDSLTLWRAVDCLTYLSLVKIVRAILKTIANSYFLVPNLLGSCFCSHSARIHCTATCDE
jgi:hypothetical protein